MKNKINTLKINRSKANFSRVLQNNSKIAMTQLCKIETRPSKLIAWCSDQSNKISILNLDTKQEYVSFEGVKLNNNECIPLFLLNLYTHISRQQPLVACEGDHGQ